MRPILYFGLTAIAATTSDVSAETTIAVLEFGPGGSVHRAASSAADSNSSAAAVASFWSALHQPSKRRSGKHAGMPVVPDMFARPDAGIVIGMQGELLESMPTAASLGAGEAGDKVVGHIRFPGRVGADVIMRASSKDVEVIAKEDIGQRLQSTAEAAARGTLEGMEALFLAVDNDDAAAVADEQLRRMLKTLEKQAAANEKTVVVHLVMESTRRRLEENRDEGEEGDGENENKNAYSYNYLTMYEIQSFNLYLWTAVGLIVLLFMVIGAFIDMPLMPDTLLYGETKIAD